MNKKIKNLLSAVMVAVLCLVSVSFGSCESGDKDKDKDKVEITSALMMAQEICKAATIAGKNLGYLESEIYDVQTANVGGWWIQAKELGGIQSVTLVGSKDSNAVFYSRIFSFPNKESAASFVKAVKDYTPQETDGYAEVQGEYTVAAGKFAVISQHFSNYNHTYDALKLEFAAFVKTQLEKLAK